jgi:hypothetical protein
MIEIQEIEEATEVQSEIQIAKIEEAAAKRTVADILIELRICLADGESLADAIQMIESNF